MLDKEFERGGAGDSNYDDSFLWGRRIRVCNYTGLTSVENREGTPSPPSNADERSEGVVAASVVGFAGEDPKGRNALRWSFNRSATRLAICGIFYVPPES